jgi:hypothetical protein
VEHEQWKSPISSLVQILLTNKPPENIIQPLEIDQYIPTLISDNASTQLVLIFSSTLVEDLVRIGNDKQDVLLHEAVQLFTYKPIKLVFIACFQSNNDTLKKSALDSLIFWIQYISFAQHSTTLRYNDLNDIFKFLMIHLANYSIESDIFQTIVSIFIDIFEKNPGLFSIDLKNEFNDLISSDWPTQKINEYFRFEDFEGLENFVSLILSFLEMDQLKFCSSIFRHENSKLLTFLLNLTNLPLKPIIEESVSKKFIDFWCKISEIFNDEFDSISLLLKEDEQLIQEIKINSKNTFGEISKIYFNKISLSITRDPGFKSSASDFFSFREDLTELFDSIYSSVGFPLFENLTNNIVNNQDLDQIETSLFLLTALSYNFSNDTVANQVISVLEVLFKSGFLSNFNNLISSNSYDLTRDLYAKTMIRFLGAIGFFYQYESASGEYLNLVIDYLFNCLTAYPSQQAITSKIILQICDDCRVQLTSSISKFEPLLVEMIQNPSINTYTREKLINSISCIIQSIPNPPTQLNHVSKIIELIETSSQPYLAEASNNSLDAQKLEYLLSLFNSLLELAKGLQTPDEFEEKQPQLFRDIQRFYSQSPPFVIDIQQRVIKLIHIFAIEIDSLSSNSQINETATQIYKNGLLEDFGAFSFSSSATLQYAVEKLPRSTPLTYAFLLELLITVFNVGLRPKSLPHQQISNNDVTNVLRTFVIDKWNIIQEDPDLTQISMSLFSSIVQNRPGFFNNDPGSFEFIAKTSIALLYTKEKFIIKSVSKFWTGLLSAKRITAEELEVLRSFIETEIGAFLTYSVFNALIDAARSDIDLYGNIIVLLLAKHPLRFKDWTKEALNKINNDRVNSGLSELQDRELFLKKLLITRGSVRKCNDQIKEFWINANGLISYK